MQLINEKVPTLLHQIATIIPQFFVWIFNFFLI
jgi:hypothetical protein